MCLNYRANKNDYQKIFNYLTNYLLIVSLIKPLIKFWAFFNYKSEKQKRCRKKDTIFIKIFTFTQLLLSFLRRKHSHKHRFYKTQCNKS